MSLFILYVLPCFLDQDFLWEIIVKIDELADKVSRQDAMEFLKRGGMTDGK